MVPLLRASLVHLFSRTLSRTPLLLAYSRVPNDRSHARSCIMPEAIFRVVGRVTTHLGQVKLVRVLFSGEYYTLTVQTNGRFGPCEPTSCSLRFISTALYFPSQIMHVLHGTYVHNHLDDIAYADLLGSFSYGVIHSRKRTHDAPSDVQKGV
jgi:hypothetical protein